MTVIGNTKIQDSFLKRWVLLLISGLLVAVTFGTSFAMLQDQKTFASPDEAVKAMLEALKAEDVKVLSAIFGPGSEDLISSGDPVADKAERERFINLYQQKNRLEEASSTRAALYIGNEDWPFPIPVVKKDGVWLFDTDEGREEIIARRIGRNELSVIQVCLAYVDAQKEYAIKDRDGDGVLAYAQKFSSEPGKKDGLYWKAKEGDEQSPLGFLVAAAQGTGYTGKQSGGKPLPYHGYYYRILKAQGKDATGGAYDYIIKGKMIGGFALVAYPAQYDSSGIMTFIVNHAGEVYQKDLGEKTEETVLMMQLFNPDNTWSKVEGRVAKGK
ncbi:MAG: DUF2950 domain-containing protein [Desulfobacterales bacterium]|nr:DUF2950 domain-containing protein [Desulfobacterales bacterium]